MTGILSKEKQLEKQKHQLRIKLLELFLARRIEFGSSSSIDEGIERIDTALNFITKNDTKSITNDIPVKSKGYTALENITYGRNEFRTIGAPELTWVNNLILASEVESENINNQ